MIRRFATAVGLLLTVLSAHAVSIVIVSVDDAGEGLNDTTPFSSVGGNNATTLGQARRNALERAAQIWGERLQGTVTIEVEVDFRNQQCSSNSGVLGSAGASAYYEEDGVLLPDALVDQLNGRDINPGGRAEPEIEANFNSRVDSDTGCLTGARFYYGFDHQAGRNIDFLNTAMHELAHGLGFASLVVPSTGQNLGGSTFARFDRLVFDENLNLLWHQMTSSQRDQSARNDGAVTWAGSQATGASSNLSSGVHPSGRVLLYAPLEVDDGSSISHWDVRARPNLLMEPFSASGVEASQDVDFTSCLLADLGWTLADGIQCPDGLSSSVPIADNQSVSVDEDSAVTITLTGSDPDGDALTFTVVDGPGRGSLSGSAPDLSYTPSPNFSGADSFRFVVSDGSNQSAVARVSISVNPIQDPPTASPKTVEVQEDGVAFIELTASDPDGDELSYINGRLPEHGQLGDNGRFRSYRPNPDYHGEDSFTFRVSDGQAESDEVTVQLIVNSVNDAPVAVAQSVQLTAGDELEITLQGTDKDGEVRFYRVTEPPILGQVRRLDATRYVYVAPARAGADRFEYVVNDGELDSEPALVTVQVDPRPGSAGGGGRLPALGGWLLAALLLRNRSRSAESD